MDAVTFKKDITVINQKFLSARSLDDRFGCAVLVQVLKALKKEKLSRRISFAWTTREEIGFHGAIPLGNRLAPDIVLAVDSLATADAPNIPFHLAPNPLGQGPVLRIYDHNAMADIDLQHQLEALAKKHSIPLQVGATGGGTDGAAFQRAGVGAKMMAISVPIRYLHSTVEMCHLDDLHNLIQLLIHASQSVDP
jgi:putative aminopeptidase FrvX